MASTSQHLLSLNIVIKRGTANSQRWSTAMVMALLICGRSMAVLDGRHSKNNPYIIKHSRASITWLFSVKILSSTTSRMWSQIFITNGQSRTTFFKNEDILLINSLGLGWNEICKNHFPKWWSWIQVMAWCRQATSHYLSHRNDGQDFKTPY